MLIALQRFGGARPRVGARLLQDNEAQVAFNCKLWEGTLQPWYRPHTEQQTVNPGPARSVYRYTDANYWLHWNQDVNAVGGPVAGTKRLYWTGDGAPRFGNVETIAGVTTLIAAAGAGANFLLVSSAQGFAVGNSVAVTLDSTVVHTTTVVSVQLSLNRINLASGLPSAAALGRAVTNTSKSYPHGSYLLGVPAPTVAPAAVAVPGGGNTGTVVSFVGGLGEQTGSTTTALQTYSIDLANIDSDERLIAFELETHFDGSIASVQSKRVIIEVIRDPASAAEVIFTSSREITFQGPASPLPGGDAPGVGRITWSSEFLAAIAAGQAAAAAEAARQTSNPRFQYLPKDGTHTYRLKLTHEFVAATASPNWTYELRITARLASQGIKLLPADHGLKEGDKVQFGGIEGTGSLVDLNRNPVSVLSVDGDTVYIESEVTGVYSGTGGIWQQVFDDVDLEARAYVYTYVATLDNLDMEGPPSPPSVIINAGDNQTVTLTGFANPVLFGDGRPYRAIRVYRTSTGDETDAEYLYVGEIAADVTEYLDSVRGTALGEVLPSATWEPPPADLVGLIELPNGRLAGFRRDGNELCLCPPYQPHAWPIAYRHTMLDDIVSIAAFGTSILVTTKGRPTLATGSDPASVSEEHVELVHPNLAKRGTVDMGYGILYPTGVGLCYVAQGVADIITKTIFTEDQWKALNPASFVAAKYGDRYFCFYDNGKERAGFILDPRDPTNTLTFVDVYASEIWSDPHNDKLYLVLVNSAGVEEIVEWNANSTEAPREYRWRSKEFTSAIPITMRVVKVDAVAYPVRVAVFADGKLYDNVDLFSEKPERLKTRDAKARKWEIEVIGSTTVEAVYVATNTETLTRYLGS